MKLTVKKVDCKLKEYQQTKLLKERAFPANEQFPMWLIKLLAWRKRIDFLVFYDNDAFIGILYIVSTDRMVFVLYLAVNDQIRSKGYKL